MIVWENYEKLNKIMDTLYLKKKFLWDFSVFRLNILNFPIFFGTFCFQSDMDFHLSSVGWLGSYIECLL